jgi:predicted aconitase
MALDSKSNNVILGSTEARVQVYNPINNISVDLVLWLSMAISHPNLPIV